MYDNLKVFFDRIKSLGLWQRIFSWRKIRTLSYDAYDEFTTMSAAINEMGEQIRKKEMNIIDLNKSLEIASLKISDLTSSAQKLENKLAILENEISRINREKTELTGKIARLEQADQNRADEFLKNITAVKAIQKGLDDERNKLNEDRIKEKEEHFVRMKQTWQSHQETVKSIIRNICRAHLIEYIENVPFKGNPDNTIMIAGEYVIFDAKSPAGDDLENFPKYLKIQTESVKKYIRQENVKSDIFLVIPSNTLDYISQFSYNMGDYYVYLITVDSLEPIILSLKKIESYEFAEQLTPDERENICRILGKFSHLAKRKIQIDYFFSWQFLDILSKCGLDLPDDIYRSVQEFEKAEKLNPAQEKRAKQILTDDLIAESEKLSNEVRAKLAGGEEDV
ncbi:MAG: hypothetical protein Q8868_11620 [Bacteroidota bacterium]|nr:hypothetical protein [Bacteroidota bacterium]